MEFVDALGVGTSQHGTDDSAPTARKVQRALVQTLNSLSAEERVIIQLSVLHGRQSAENERTLHLRRKSLYRRLPRMLNGLRRKLELGGITVEDVDDFLDEAGQ